MRAMYIVEVSERTNIGNWDRDLSCNILAKNVSAFFPCLKNLPKTKLKSNKSKFLLLLLEIRGQLNIDVVICNLSYVYSLKSTVKMKKLDRKKYKMRSLKQKKITKKYNTRARVHAEKKKEIKKRPDLKWNKKGGPSRQDPNHLSVQLVKAKDLRNFLLLKNFNKSRLLM